MEYKKYEFFSYNIYTVKTNRFKTCQMEIMYKSKAEKELALPFTFLVDLMTDVGADYKSHKEVVKKLEEYYQASFYGTNNKVGNILMTSFNLSFLNPNYVNDSNYLENVLKFSLQMILNPLINAGEFDIKSFNIVKNRLHDEILGANENINSLSLKNALGKLDDNSPSSFTVLGSIDELNNITPKNLVDYYQKLMNKPVDIYVIGNMDMDNVANIITKYFKKRIINFDELPIYYENRINKKAKLYHESSKFLETNLVNIYNLVDLDKKEKTSIVHFYNYLLGGGGLNTKLYQLLREKNSLCYTIKSMYFKYDNLLIIETSIAKQNIKKASKLIDLAIKQINAGDFTQEELNSAKENFIFSLNLALDNIGGILNNYIFHVLDDLPLLEERIKIIKDITKEEIIEVSKKIKVNLKYVLEGDSNEKN